MRTRQLGRSGLTVSRAALGTMNFGAGPEGRCDDDEARRIIGAFLDGGGTLIDTADNYNGGRSEELVGEAVGTHRDEVVLATKGGGPSTTYRSGVGLSRRHLTRALEGSLRRLRTDHVDLYQCHLPDPRTPAEETMAVLNEFVRSGKVRYVGCSNYSVGQLWAAQTAARSTPLVGLQAHYSLLARDIELEVVPTCAQLGLGLLAYGPLASGMLAGGYAENRRPDPDSRMGQWLNHPQAGAAQWVQAMTTPDKHRIVDVVRSVANDLGSTPATVSIAWLVAQHHVTSVILGPSSTDQLRSGLDALEFELTTAALARLTEASAPEQWVPNGIPREVQAASA